MTGSMEVPYLLLMLRRRFWVLVLGLLLGVLLAILLGMGQERYRAQAQLLIGAPPTGSTDANSLERNLISQLSVLRSRGTAAAVAEKLEGAVTTDEVVQSTTISEVAGSDVVIIESQTVSASLSEAIAGGYVEVYLAQAAASAQSRIAPEVERLDARLAAVNEEITATNQQLKAAVAPYLRQTNNSVPDPRTVAPEAAARQQLLVNEYDRLLAARQELEQQQQLQSRSTVLQEAVADADPVGPDRRRQAGVVLIAGLVSVAVALAIDTVSGRTVGDQEVEQALGTRIAARLKLERRGLPAALLREDRVPTEDERLLWLKAERLCPKTGTGLVAVTGAAPGSGTTTTALALARHFADSGSRTVLVDTVGGPGSLTELTQARDTWRTSSVLRDPSALGQALTALTPGLSVLGHARGELAYPRGVLSGLVAALDDAADVVVLDSAPGLGSAAGAGREAHAVVLTVDASHSKAKQLEELGVVLADHQDRLLPVLTQPARQSRRRRRRLEAERRLRLPEPAGSADVDERRAPVARTG